MDEFYIPPDKRFKITADELAMRILAALQHNTAPGVRTGHSPNQLSSILAFQLRKHGEQRDQAFDSLFAQAKGILYRKGMVYVDPEQGSRDDFVCLTDEGRRAKPDTMVVGIASTETFLARLQDKAGLLDATSLQYIKEAYNAASHELWLSCAFMLGGAAERLILVLADHVDTLIGSPTESGKLAQFWRVRQVKEWALDQMPALRKRYPMSKDAFSDVQDKVDALFAMYRYERNDSGHPKEQPYVPDPEQLKAMLLSFGTFAAAITKIKNIPPLP